MEKSKFKPNGVALLPFFIFVVVYLRMGVILVVKGDPMGFYGFKGTIAVIVYMVSQAGRLFRLRLTLWNFPEWKDVQAK